MYPNKAETTFCHGTGLLAHAHRCASEVSIVIY